VTSFESWSHFTCPYHTRQWNKGDSDYVPNFGVQIVLTCLAQNWVPKPFKPRHIRSRTCTACAAGFFLQETHIMTVLIFPSKPPFLFTYYGLVNKVAPNLVVYHFYIKVAISVHPAFWDTSHFRLFLFGYRYVFNWSFLWGRKIMRIIWYTFPYAWTIMTA
jgi:hypothetical protein